MNFPLNLSGRPMQINLALGKPATKLAQTPAQVKTAAVGAMLIPLAITAATTYVGFKLGSQEEGLPAVLGYGVGALGALGAIGSLLVTIGVLKAPTPAITSQDNGPGTLV